SKERYNTSKIELNISMIIFLVEKVNVNCNTYKNGWIYLLVIITIICYLNFTEPIFNHLIIYDKGTVMRRYILRDMFLTSRDGLLLIVLMLTIQISVSYLLSCYINNW